MHFMFQHCRYTEACNLFFPLDSLPAAPLPSSYQSQAPSSSPQKPGPLATDYGTLDELCDLCVAFGVVPILERVIAARSVDTNNPDSPVSQHTASALTRICTYFENHRHFNHLYRFQVTSNLSPYTYYSWVLLQLHWCIYCPLFFGTESIFVTVVEG
jgi:zinc finger FYVE domain-containing protein 26